MVSEHIDLGAIRERTLARFARYTPPVPRDRAEDAVQEALARYLARAEAPRDPERWIRVTARFLTMAQRTGCKRSAAGRVTRVEYPVGHESLPAGSARQSPVQLDRVEALQELSRRRWGRRAGVPRW